MTVIRASVVQACTAAFSFPDTLAKLRRLASVAKDEGAQLAVFPEAFVGGYPKESTFGAKVGTRTDEGRDEFARYYQAAVELPSPELTEIETVAREVGIFLVLGVIERDLGTLYCTAIFVDPIEGFVAKHRKLMPTAAERLIWGQGGPDTLAVVEKQFAPAVGNNEKFAKVKLTATICWENYMPLLRTFYYSKGTQIYCAPTVDARETWQSTMRHIALEGRCFVLSACQFAQRKDYPAERGFVEDDASRDPERVVIAGGSVILNPLGKVLAGPLLDREGVLTADLDLDDIARGKFDLDAVGHYARSDSGSLPVSYSGV
ncbi:carbon-nitrogen hydrolase [Vararia minispora EC-137]|uniref:Carbon-nitrogen hydrolase n=1 Tax=Vararia minispora EC-137 TaxID=1314806 RepID=A0ACB8QNZ8_9AGAM|nr:carbon-nitrogen hydrolase [Vararia minispora EC-137]